MYYSHRCSYCTKIFYTFDNNKTNAAKKLYHAIKKHLQDYNEDHKEYKFDEAPEIEVNQMYKEMTESTEKPRGAYLV
ncbi:MAG TPA: hypothetical protein VLF89_04260 [Candidatus Saccharimonadales bacterium]|nr:hypothetical protein [Candidatus Saccharimonadales bacterium]